MKKEWEKAARRGSTAELEQLFSAGLDINARDAHGQTALMIAALEGNGELASWLVGRGANLNHTAKYGLSALMLAVIASKEEIVRSLIGAGADLRLRGTGAPGFEGKTALDLAIAQGNSEIIEILKKAGESR